MPILTKNNTYTNDFGYSGATYVSNAGDETTLTLTVSELIRITSIGNPLSFDPIMNVLKTSNSSWLKEGFRVGDVVKIVKYDSVGAVLVTHHSNVTNVTDTDLNVDTWTTGLFYDSSANEIMAIIPVVSVGGVARRRSDLLIEFNHSLNNEIGSSASLIDGETTKIYFNALDTLAPLDVSNGALVGNQSGQFFESGFCEYIGLDSDGFHEYEITLKFVNSGIYQAENFELNECLKIFVRGLWSSKAGEVFNRSEFRVDEQANTGWFNEANNISVPTGGAVLVPITNLAFNNPNENINIQVDLAGTDVEDLAIGGAYVSIDDAYYKNKPTSQRNLTYLLPTTIIEVGETYPSFDNLGGEWELTINSITPSGGNATINLDLVFNATLSNFFDARLDDRLFYLWLKIGNTNHLAFLDQLSKVVPTGGVLVMNEDYGFLDHSQNETIIDESQTGFSADIEDDVAYYGTFNLEKNKTSYQNINLRVEAFNTSSDASFILQQTNFNFGAVIFQESTGKYLLNQSAVINPILQTTSNKRNALVRLTGVEDAETYEVSVYYPFLLNWRYWLTLEGVNSDFAPNYNQDWLPYGNVNDWTIRMVVELQDDNLFFTHSNTIQMSDYDFDDNISSEIVVRRVTDNAILNVIPKSEIVIVESTHENLLGNWDLQKMWGQITVEPNEGAPRWMLSTIQDFDNNSSNPLMPISGNLLSLEVVSLNLLKLICKFDCSKIDFSNGLKFTAKIKQGLNNIVTVNKLTTSNEDKITTDEELKILS